MRMFALIALCLTGLVAVLAPGLAALARPAPEGAATLLVLAAPWGGGPQAVVASAGGRVIGPAATALSVTATGASPAALNKAGAWAVLDAGAVVALCAPESGE